MEKCARVREIVSQVDWDCNVITLFRESNLGVTRACSEAITWFFSQEEEGIILEDDCLPHQSFFFFCQAMLEKYRHDQRVMHIAGTNLQFGRRYGEGSYYFSNVVSIWGWAGWSRTWSLYDIDMGLFPKFKISGLAKSIIPDKAAADQIMNILELNYTGNLDAWDHQYGFAVAVNNGLCVVPNVNLISNLGYSRCDEPLADDPYMLSRIPRQEIERRLAHPLFFIPYKDADIFHLRWNVFDTREEGQKRISRSDSTPAIADRPSLINRLVNKARRSVISLKQF